MMVSAIDVGSYSIRLGIANTDPFEIIYEQGQIVELGSGVKANGYLKEDIVSKAIDIIKEYKNISNHYNVNNIIAVGTEALRKAKNSNEFIEKVLKETGISIDIISSQEEGRLSYLSSIYSLELTKNNLVIDQGGGSTEYIYGIGKSLKEINSLDFGIVSLTEGFFHHDPPTEEEIESLFDFLDVRIRSISKPTDTIIGIGGTITTIAALHYDIYPYNGKLIHGKILSYDVIKRWFWELAKKSTEQRRLYKHIEDKRAKAIVSGIAIFYKTLELFDKDHLIVSDFGLKHGLLLKASKLID